MQGRGSYCLSNISANFPGSLWLLGFTSLDTIRSATFDYVRDEERTKRQESDQLSQR